MFDYFKMELDLIWLMLLSYCKTNTLVMLLVGILNIEYFLVFVEPLYLNFK